LNEADLPFLDRLIVERLKLIQTPDGRILEQVVLRLNNEVFKVEN